MKTMEKPQTEGGLDLSRYSKEKREALEVTEEARGKRITDGFATGLFLGRPQFKPLIETAASKSRDGDEGERFLKLLRHVLDHHADPDEIDRSGEIPDDILKRLADLGAFGIKIPKKYSISIYFIKPFNKIKY